MTKTIAGISLIGMLSLVSGLAMTREDRTAHQGPARTVEVGGGDIANVIQQVARGAGQPIGWVVASDDQSPCVVTRFKMASTEPGEALNVITAQCPKYTWVRDRLGMVVQPARAMKSILDLPIHDISLTNTTAFGAEYAVQHLPEVKQWLQVNNLRPFDVEPGDKWRGDTATFSIDLHDAPLREVLNEIAVKSGRLVWKVVWFDHDAYLGIFL